MTLLRLPNSAGINPDSRFLLKFLWWCVASVSIIIQWRWWNQIKKQYNSQFQEMFQITKGRRNCTTNFVIWDVPAHTPLHQYKKYFWKEINKNIGYLQSIQITNPRQINWNEALNIVRREISENDTKYNQRNKNHHRNKHGS